MKINPHSRWRGLLLAWLGLAALGLQMNPLVAWASAGVPSIAGLSPHERPAGAPQLRSVPPVDRQLALFGVSTPVPKSIEGFLQHQGGWFNPFLHPGMTGPYDLRGWHAAPVEARKP